MWSAEQQVGEGEHMRIIVNGQQAFGRACLEAIVDRGIDTVVAACTSPDRDAATIDPLKAAALERRIPLVQPASYDDPGVLDRLNACEADLMVMAYVSTFVREVARQIPTRGSICFHPSMLPLHRGPSSMNWPIIWGRERTGLSIFWPNDGLDEGDLLLQESIEIGPDDTVGSLYFEKIFPRGVDAVLRAIDLVRAGDPPRIVQDGAQATYEGWCREDQAAIDWWRSAREVYNLIRGTDPRPGAWTTFRQERLQLYSCSRVMAHGRPGEVSEVTDDAFTVVAGGGGIRVGRVRFGGAQKVSAGGFARDHVLTVGTRLG